MKRIARLTGLVRLGVALMVGACGRDIDAGYDQPRGTNDPWADEIVARRFRYVQVNTPYDQTADITPQGIAKLPPNAFTSWIKAKQPGIIDWLLRVSH